MKHFTDLVAECLPHIKELFPWDLDQLLKERTDVLLLDTREPYEFEAARIDGSLNVPRGILEAACEYGYEDTVPELVQARTRPVVVICRSGNRSALAAWIMQQMGYQDVYSLKTGLRGWNDYELPLVKGDGEPLDVDSADEYFTTRLRPDQIPPKD
ncbi:MAG: rhodanese-like domain-containing protein [Gammaproteobacteria bacterium]|jgi:rhodanese-related sulfurtransferase|nr:rhodanese-like domain-containing protein [Gammaproteobacteria bacterium]